MNTQNPYSKHFDGLQDVISSLNNINNGCSWADALIPYVLDIIPFVDEYRTDWETFWSAAIPEKFWNNDDFVSDFDFQAEMYHNINVPQ